MKIKYLFKFVILLMMPFFQGCSDNPISVQNEKWECNKENAANKCLVEFDLQRIGGVAPIDVEIRIRAHRISGDSAGGDGYRNDVVANKKIRLQMESDETLHFSEQLAAMGRVTSVVISAWPSQ